MRRSSNHIHLQAEGAVLQRSLPLARKFLGPVESWFMAEQSRATMLSSDPRQLMHAMAQHRTQYVW